MSPLVNLANLQQFAAINLLADPGYNPADRHIPQCIEVRLDWAQDSGIFAHNVLHASYSGPYPGDQTMANAIMTGLSGSSQFAALNAFMNDTGSFASVTLRDLNVEHTATVTSISPPVAGLTATGALPNEVSAVITLRTAQVGRSFRGRIYVPNFAVNALGVGNTINPATVTALGNWASIIAGVLSGHGLTLGVAHFSRLAYTTAAGKPVPARPPGIVPVLSVLVRDNHWDSQRRRGRK